LARRRHRPSSTTGRSRASSPPSINWRTSVASDLPRWKQTGTWLSSS